MSKAPNCGCGCGTKLNPRKDGSFATYAPGGHDAKHKSALIRTVLESDNPGEVEAATEILQGRDWIRFLDKAREARTKKVQKQAARKDPARHSRPASATDNAIRFGLTERDLSLLEFPPTQNTWICDQSHGYPEDDPERLLMNSGDDCWFCHTPRPDSAPFAFPLFEQALERLGKVDTERLIGDCRYDMLGDTLSWKQRSEAPDSLLLARKIHWLYKKWLGGGLDTKAEEVDDGAEVTAA